MCLTIEQFERRLDSQCEHGECGLLGLADFNPPAKLWRYCRDKIIAWLAFNGLRPCQIARLWVSDLYRDNSVATVLIINRRLSFKGECYELYLSGLIQGYLAQMNPQLPLIREVESIHAIRRYDGGPALTLESVRRILKKQGWPMPL